MLFVDTASLLLLGLSSLKLASFFSINKEAESEKIDQDQKHFQKYKNNISMINKFSRCSMYLFIFIALIQLFVVFNGLTQLDLIYSERVLKFEKEYQINQNKLQTEPEINKENNTPLIANSFKKDRFYEVITKQKNSAISYLARDVIKVFLMSLVWAYGFFKLFKFS
tara:strand:- start:2451 stop:2951 length:501 start_codon:yes stop_codon:yes gene_type:complete